MGLPLLQFKHVSCIVKNIVTDSAKDINSIYSYYNLTQHKYIETTENDSYVQAKNKWLVFQANGACNTLSQAFNKQTGLETEAI